VASSMRRLVGTATLAMLVGSFVFAGVAGAGIMIPDEGPGPCTFEVVGSSGSATLDVGFPHDVSISVTAPADVDVSVFISTLPAGTPVEYGPETSSGAPMAFGPVQLLAPSSITAGYTTTDGSAYTATCSGPGGVAAIQVLAAAANVVDSGTRPLAFTGSDDTTTHVLIAAAAIVLGTVLVVGTRRRHRVKA
jgi:hypothetical protein